MRAAGFEYFVHLRYQLGCAACRTPQLVPSRSLMFSHLLVSKLCCGNINVHAADLIPNCAKHWLFTSKCLLSVSRPIFFYSLIRNLFLSAQNIVFSQVKCNLCASRPIFSYSLIRNLCQTAKNIVFSQVNAACVSRPIFSYSLIHNLFQHAQNIVFSQVGVHASLVPFFLFPNSRLIRLTWPCQ